MSLQITTVEVDDAFKQNVQTWLENLKRSVSAPDYGFLLAHMDDGVLWGRFKGNDLLLSAQAFPNQLPVKLEAETLQTLRLFGDDGELLIWRTAPMHFAGRLLLDAANDDIEQFSERQLLWGEHTSEKNGFTLLVEGEQGFLHAPPIVLQSGQRACIVVRNFIDYDDDNQAAIAASRLVGIEPYVTGGTQNVT